MYGPFGSFAPTYDTAFATLSKNDSSLLLSTYGSELGVSYANRLAITLHASNMYMYMYVHLRLYALWFVLIDSYHSIGHN